jgi:hypothetical protein
MEEQRKKEGERKDTETHEIKKQVIKIKTV